MKSILLAGSKLSMLNGTWNWPIWIRLSSGSLYPRAMSTRIGLPTFVVVTDDVPKLTDDTAVRVPESSQDALKSSLSVASPVIPRRALRTSKPSWTPAAEELVYFS